MIKFKKLTISKKIYSKSVKAIFSILFIILNILIFFNTQEVKAENTVRVAFPIQKGITEIDDNGNYSGYTYDYLMEVSQYTNWKYEFVCVDGDTNTQISTLMNMLINGEIDLMGGMLYMDSLKNLIDYSGYNYGITYSALYVLNENTELNSSNYTTFDKLRIAVIESSTKHSNKLKQFAEMNNIQVEEIYCKSDVDQIEALKQGKADALLNTDVNIIDKKLRMLVRFAPEPFYLTTTKGKIDIINGLNSAISNINASNPYFLTTLHEKYFSMDNHELYLSNSEREYVKQSNILKVAMLGENAPIQYKNNKTEEIKGISKEILDYISENTGLKFEIIYTDSIEDYYKLIENQQVDLVAGIMKDYKDIRYQNYYTTTISYMDTPIVMAINSNINPSELDNRRLAILKNNENTLDDKGQRVYYNTVKECIDALHQGEADYFYGNSYILQYYINSKGYKDVIVLPQSLELLQKTAFGVLKTADVNLISIINKSILSISENKLQNILYTNAFQDNKITLISYIKANPWQSFMFVIIIIMILITIILSLTAQNYKHSSQRTKLENQRYEMLSEISNEFLYEYDIINDKLKLPEKCAQFLDCNKVIENLSKEIQLNISKNFNTYELFEYIVSSKEGNKEILFHTLNGSSRWLKVISKTVLNANNKPAYSVGKIVDIQKEKEKQAQLLEKSQKDSLTSIYNSATIRQKIVEILNNSEMEYAGALFIMDVDHFKEVNDNFGHYTGDAVLIEVANILKNVARKDDLVGRLGGDEFIIFMKDLSNRLVISDKCNLICSKIKNIEIMGQKNVISISIGVTLAKPHQIYSELYKEADKALYIVKKRGRDGFEII